MVAQDCTPKILNSPISRETPLIDGQSEIGRRPKKIGPQNALKRSKMGSKPRKSPPQAGKFWD